MALASSQHSFVAAAVYFSTTRIRRCRPHSPNPILAAAKLPPPSDGSKVDENRLAKLAIVTLAAGVLSVGSLQDAAFAAKTGGRVGGQAFRSAAPRPSSPRINNNSRTNIYINPRVAPPLVGGYGYGYGYGWSPFSFFAPSPSVVVGIGGGFDTLFFFIFLGTVAAFARRLFGNRQQDFDDDDE